MVPKSCNGQHLRTKKKRSREAFFFASRRRSLRHGSNQQLFRRPPGSNDNFAWWLTRAIKLTDKKGYMLAAV